MCGAAPRHARRAAPPDACAGAATRRLARAASLHIEYPLLFQISNLREGRTSHCGVLEFVAEEGVVYLPYWVRELAWAPLSRLPALTRRRWRCGATQMMQNLLLQEGDIVKLKSTSLPKGTFAKLRAQSKDFLEITNPKAVCVAQRLPVALRGSCAGATAARHAAAAVPLRTRWR
jgi:hypothetical protein